MQPTPRTLYRRSKIPEEYLLCFPDGTCWWLYTTPAPFDPDSTEWGWSWGLYDNPPRLGPAIVSDLSDEEIWSLESPKGRKSVIVGLLAKRALAPRLLDRILSEVEG